MELLSNLLNLIRIIIDGLDVNYLIICWLVNSMNEEIGENFTFVESST